MTFRIFERRSGVIDESGVKRMTILFSANLPLICEDFCIRYPLIYMHECWQIDAQ